MLVTVNKMLEKHNKTIYGLSKEINCDYQSLKRLCNNESTKISLYMIEDICKALHCSPNQIFQLEDSTTKEDCHH
jgi:DNA-binding Xre family transcriptional regulator